MKNAIRLLGALLATLTFSTAHALVLGVTEGVTYRATDAEIEARFEGIAKALGSALKQSVKVQVFSSYDATRAAMKAGQVDVIFIHPAHVALEAVKAGNYRSVAWTAGFTQYKVTFLCNQLLPLTDWTTLSSTKGLVTPDADSITAAMTRAMLREHGVPLPSVKIQVTRYQDAVPFYIENGFAAYGATASRGVVKAWTDKGGKTCADSRPVPIKQWLTATKLDADTTTTIRETLLGLSQSDSGKKALAPSTYSGFVAVTPEVEKGVMTWLGL